MITRHDGNVRPSSAVVRPAKAASWAATLAFVAALVCLAPAAPAADKYWADGSGQWDVAGNWTPSDQPQAGDDVYLTQSDGADRTVTYSNTTNPTALLNSLTIDATGLGTMALDMPNGHALSVTTEYVGYDGRGAVTQSAGTHTAKTLYLGYSAAGEGTYTLTGGTLSSSVAQYIGYAGTGILNIQTGGQVSNAYGYLGYSSGSAGTATVTGAGSTWTNSGDLCVGYKGTGILNIQGGGRVFNRMGYLGCDTGSNGTVTVDGSGSTWINSDLWVGYAGTGILNIQGGGQVSSYYGYLGWNAGSSGTVTVDGTGSTWTNSLDLRVGYAGSGVLNIQGGGQVSCYSGYLGYNNAGSDGAATVDGIGSKWTCSDWLCVGNIGIGTLNIQNGGQALCNVGLMGFAGGSEGTATVDGIGSTWTHSSGLFVGAAGTGTLNIQNGGHVSNRDGNLGLSSGSSGTVTVDGTGSVWTNTGSLYVGGSSSAAGGTGTLTVQNGGQARVGGTLRIWPAGTVTLDGGTIATQAFDRTAGTFNWNAGTVAFTNNLLADAGEPFGSSVSVTAGRDLEVAGTLTLGAGGTVTLDGGAITTSSFQNMAGGTFDHCDGTLTVRSGTYAPGTADLTVDGNTPTALPHLVLDGAAASGPFNYLYVGNSAQGALTICGGGQVSLDSASILGYSSGSTGTATVTGGGSSWANSGVLIVGEYGNGALNIEAGGQVSNSDNAYLGGQSGSTGIATVTGDGSTWTIGKHLYVGTNKTGTLNIEAGGKVSNTYGYLTGTATVTGDGSTWTNSNLLDISYGGTLTIEDGGQVSSSSGLCNATATVTGDGSTWINTGNLSVGLEGTGTLTIEAGGRISNSGAGRLGRWFHSTGTATVTGDGSTWTNGGDLRVGECDGAGTLNIQAGAEVTNAGAYLGYNAGSGTATVTGDGSAWTSSGDLYVGYDDGSYMGDESTGTLNIEAGGEVGNTVGYLGHDSDCTGTVTVDGIGSVWNNTNSLYVGGSSSGAGGTGSVTVRNGGHVAVEGTLKLWKADSAVTVDAGTLTAGALEGTTGTVRITDPAGGAALTLGSATSGTFSAALRDDTGPGSLTKVGAGAQTLSGTGITYTGTTTVLEGTLRLSNTRAFASGILNDAATEFEVTGGSWIFMKALGGAGRFTKSGAGTLVVAGPQDYDPGAALDVLGGALALNTDASGTGLMADAHLALSVSAAELRFGASQHLDTLSVGDGGNVVFTGADLGVMKHLANTGTIDLTTGSLVVDYAGPSPLADVRAMLASGYAGGLWDGPGIHSSNAAAEPNDLTAVGVLDNTDPKVGGKTTFEGEAVDATAVLVKYTWAGDANLDGVIDANDYDVIDPNYLIPPAPANTGWWTGDFNHDGVVDANDYDCIDRALLFQTGPLAAGGVMPVVTPEPATLALLALGGLGLLGLRRRPR